MWIEKSSPVGEIYGWPWKVLATSQRAPGWARSARWTRGMEGRRSKDCASSRGCEAKGNGVEKGCLCHATSCCVREPSRVPRSSRSTQPRAVPCGERSSGEVANSATWWWLRVPMSPLPGMALGDGDIGKASPTHRHSLSLRYTVSATTPATKEKKKQHKPKPCCHPR